MKIKYLRHKNGDGRITAIHSVGHSTYDGVADWFYLGDVEWENGGKLVRATIPPWAIYFDHDIPDAHKEYNRISSAMTDYLATAGNWHDIKFYKGRAVSWTPKKRNGSVPV